MSLINPENQSTGVFAPFGKNYVEVKDAPSPASFVEIVEHMGYHTDEVHMYMGDYDLTRDIQTVGFEYLSGNIAFVCTKKSVIDLDPRELTYFIRNFNRDEEYNHPDVVGHLRQAIENRSLTTEFLSRVLNLGDLQSDSIIDVPALGLYFYFNDGILTDFQSSDGLNEWAKYLRQANPVWMINFEKVARKYRGNNPSGIAGEINTQAEAYANLPDGLRSTYLTDHEAELGTMNFKMLLVCHHDHQITLSEFKELNCGRYKLLTGQVSTGLEKYILGKFLYEFAEDGRLINHFKTN